MNDCIIYNTNALDGFYNGYILYDGTHGKYHKEQHSNKKHYLDLKEKNNSIIYKLSIFFFTTLGK